MPARPWFPFYGGDYLADTAHLTNELHGCYLKLMIHAWNHDGVIPSDIREIAIVLGVHTNKAKTLWGKLEDFWYKTGGVFRHKRIDKELQQAIDNSEKRRSAARKRWDANAMQKHMQTTSTTTEESQKDSSPPPSLLDSSSESRGEESLAEASSASHPAPCQCPHQKLVELYHRHCPTLPRVKVLTERRQQFTRQRWREVLDGRGPEEALSWFGKFFERVNRSGFLTGQVANGQRRAFVADFEWLMRQSNFVKVHEGRYDG